MKELVMDIIVRVIIGIVVIYIAPAIKNWLEAAKKNEELRGLIQIAETVAKAVEQKYRDDTGTFRKEKALEDFAKMANSRGLYFNHTDADRMLESAVDSINEYRKYWK